MQTNFDGERLRRTTCRTDLSANVLWQRVMASTTLTWVKCSAKHNDYCSETSALTWGLPHVRTGMAQIFEGSSSNTESTRCCRCTRQDNIQRCQRIRVRQVPLSSQGTGTSKTSVLGDGERVRVLRSSVLSSSNLNRKGSARRCTKSFVSDHLVESGISCWVLHIWLEQYVQATAT